MTAALRTLDQAAADLHKTRRWLAEFLRKTKTDPHGRPLYRLAGRDKLVYLDRVIEALPCPRGRGQPSSGEVWPAKWP
jgi:hypothetical protein